MQFALMSGLVAFLATVLLIPRFITFYQAKRIEGQQTVSYTHLTLPTICSV